MRAMNFLRSKYVNNPVVAAIILVSGSLVLGALDDRTEPIFTRHESTVIGTICDVIAFPAALLDRSGLLWHSKSHAVQVADILLILLVVIGTWAAIIYFVRALYWRMRGLKR